MEFKIIYSKRAKLQLDNCLLYLSEVLNNKKAAEKLIMLVEDVLIRLEDNPYEFPLYDNENCESKDYHVASLIKMQYKIIYKIENDKVFIVGFFSNLEDFKSKSLFL